MSAPAFKGLNRKQRRALQFAGRSDTFYEQHKAGLAQVEAKQALEEGLPPVQTVIKEVDGWIAIPEFDGTFMPYVINYMIPYADLDDKYKSAAFNYSGQYREKCEGNVPAAYQALLSEWFYGGLLKLELTFKPNVRCANGDTAHNAIMKRLRLYLGEILGSFEPSHEHKFAYLVYVLDMVCTNARWTPCK
ncbi:hypothetical protein [Burkholderia phage BCSR5]|nr:hypothetical protein [Burkholderia phage BCSR5]